MLQDSKVRIDHSYEKWWYTDDIVKTILPKLKEGLDQRGKEDAYRQILLKLALNKEKDYKETITGEEIEIFFDSIYECLKYIDDDIILQNQDVSVEKQLLISLFEFKYSDRNQNSNQKLDKSIEWEDKGPSVFFKGKQILGYKDLKLFINVLDYEDGILKFDCLIKFPEFFSNNGSIRINLDGRWHTTIHNRVYTSTKYFNTTIYKSYSFHGEVDISQTNNASSLSFVYSNDGKEYVVPIVFTSPMGKLHKSITGSYWVAGDKIITYEANKKIIKFENLKKSKILSLEYEMVKDLNKNKDIPPMKRLYFTFLRIMGLIGKTIRPNNRIWIFYDKLYKAGDNDDYLFQYASKQNDGINKYYVLDKSSSDFNRFRNQFGKRILKSGSFRQRYLVLRASTIFSTHADPYRYLSFRDGFEKRFFMNLFDAEMVLIYHGLIIPQLAKNIRKTKANIKRVYCVSKFEKRNLLHSAYGYDEEMIHTLGAPRYDGLKNNNKKLIVIAPTWRNNLKVSDFNKAENFLESEYFKIYKGLLENSSLSNIAIDNNYKLLFVVHPTISDKAELFKVNNNVSVVSKQEGLDYEQILSDASILITDYSGIQFDMGYLHKPVVYYQPPSLAPQYDNGVFSYEDNGFGPVCHDENNVIDELIALIDRNCITSEKYVSRMKDFFEYSDSNNCKRIYEDMLKHSNNNSDSV